MHMMTIYNLETGKAHSHHPVDANEMLARGGWSLTPPQMRQDEEEPSTPETPTKLVETDDQQPVQVEEQQEEPAVEEQEQIVAAEETPAAESEEQPVQVEETTVADGGQKKPALKRSGKNA